MVAAVDWYPHVTDEQKSNYILKHKPELRGKPELEQKLLDPEVVRATRVEAAERYWVSGPGQLAGFVLAMAGVCIVGATLASVVGRTLWRYFEGTVMRAPLVRRVYPYIKQVTDLFLAEKRLSFLRVVAVEYPRKESWSIGFVTGSGLRSISSGCKKEFITVFVPTSPTPFTGYVIMTARDEAIELDMTVEEAVRFIISGGVITPGRQDNSAEISTDGARVKPD
jgi:uncharacterized membrane protein